MVIPVIPTHPTTTRAPMDPLRRTALVAGIFYLVTFISIPTLALYDTLKTDPKWILGTGDTNGVLVGGLLEVIVALAGIGTAVTLYPVLRRQHEGMALGLVATRSLEAAMIFVGVLSVVTMVHLREDVATAPGADPSALVTTGVSMVVIYKGTFLIGQTLMPALNALLLGTLMYRSGLVPRALPVLGLIGAPLLLTSTVAVYFGVIDQISPWTAVATLPIAAWELGLGLWLTFKGFRACRLTTGGLTPRTPPALQDTLA